MILLNIGILTNGSCDEQKAAIGSARFACRFSGIRGAQGFWHIIKIARLYLFSPLPRAALSVIILFAMMNLSKGGPEMRKYIANVVFINTLGQYFALFRPRCQR
jgi:hypothetical protein